MPPKRSKKPDQRRSNEDRNMVLAIEGTSSSNQSTSDGTVRATLPLKWRENLVLLTKRNPSPWGTAWPASSCGSVDYRQGWASWTWAMLLDPLVLSCS